MITVTLSIDEFRALEEKAKAFDQHVSKQRKICDIVFRRNSKWGRQVSQVKNPRLP